MNSFNRVFILGIGLTVVLTVGCAPKGDAVEVGTKNLSGDNVVATNNNPATNPSDTTAPPVTNQGPTGQQSTGAPRNSPNANATGGAPQPGPQNAPSGQQPGGQGGQGRQGGGGGRGVNIAFLLSNDQFKKELGITADQAKKLAAVIPAPNPGGQGGPGGPATGAPGGQPGGQQQSPEERQKQREELQKKVDAILTSAQKDRVRQIGYQMSGVRAFSNPDVVKALAISADQAAKLEAVMPQRGQGGGAPGGGQQMSPEERQKQREEVMKKALEVLTPDQKAKWEKMKGKPFQFQFQQRGGGMGGPGGPGGAVRAGG